MYKTFLLKFTKNVVYASGFSFLYERFNQKYMYDTALYSPLPKNSSHYKLIHTIFCEMGADLSKKNLKIATTDKPTGILAGCSSFPFASDYDVMVSMSMVRRLSKKTEGRLTTEDILKAIMAHEAIHAIENHQFFITLSASSISMFVFDLCQHYRLPVGMRLTASIMACSAVYIALSKQMEYRADELAATHDPKIRDTLIHILMMTEHKSDVSANAVPLHPSNAERINHLQKLSLRR